MPSYLNVLEDDLLQSLSDHFLESTCSCLPCTDPSPRGLCVTRPACALRGASSGPEYTACSLLQSLSAAQRVSGFDGPVLSVLDRRLCLAVLARSPFLWTSGVALPTRVAIGSVRDTASSVSSFAYPNTIPRSSGSTRTPSAMSGLCLLMRLPAERKNYLEWQTMALCGSAVAAYHGTP